MPTPIRTVVIEDRDHPVWTVGFNARVNLNPRRVNQFPLKTVAHAHWDYGWVAANNEIDAVRRRRMGAV